MRYETERLLVRPTSFDDASFILQLMNTPKWLANIGDRKVRTEADAKQYITEKMLPQLNSHGYSNCTIIIKTSQQKIGTCGLYHRDGLDHADIGFALLPEFEGKGFAFEAASQMIKLGFDKYRLPQISAITTKENLASQKLILALGLHFDKIINIPNDPEDLLLYHIFNKP